MKEDFFNIFPEKIRNIIDVYIKEKKIEEIRVGIKKPLILMLNNKEILTSYIIDEEDFKYIIQRISNFSLYAYEEEIREGFITIKGGHRVGLAGECVMENNKIKTIRNISSLNIRISKEIIGASKNIMKFILKDNKVNNTLIISPPKCGKTTLLRDISRNISNMGKRVAIIDERSEIAGCYKGIPQMDVGIRSDVLDNCLKSRGIIMAIRSLAPEVIICDEIGSKEDINSLVMAFNSGVSVISTLHGFDIWDLFYRKVFKDILDNKILDLVIVLSNKNKQGEVKGIYKMEKEGEGKFLKLL
ncbi:MAG: stage III sporulation protein AA [Clostridium sp.]